MMMSMIPKALFTALPSTQYLFNPAYDPKKDSHKYFCTNTSINGEYFRSRTDNKYFQIVKKDWDVGSLQHLTHFYPSTEMRYHLDRIKYDPDKWAIAFLEFSKDKEYFVESNQAIKAGNPDVTVVNNAHLEKLIADLPKFVPLPDDIM
jgi:hypothetical protein